MYSFNFTKSISFLTSFNISFCKETNQSKCNKYKINIWASCSIHLIQHIFHFFQYNYILLWLNIIFILILHIQKKNNTINILTNVSKWEIEISKIMLIFIKVIYWRIFIYYSRIDLISVCFFKRNVKKQARKDQLS